MKRLLISLTLTAAVISADAQVWPVGDLNEDRRVDIRDLQMFAEQWLDEDCLIPGCAADLNGVGGVNATDFAIFAAHWRTEGSGLVISEFMASNGSQAPLEEGELLDEDGDSSDWIEIYNPTANAVALGGWHLTNDVDDLAKWDFPPGVVIEPKTFLIVFASGKETTGTELHAGFNLNAGGGYLALVEEDGSTIVSEYDYPPQLTNVSYGVSQSSMILIGDNETCSYRVPQAADADAEWTAAAFDDSAWSTGRASLGFVLAPPEPADVTQPGDPVQGVPNDGNWPANEAPPLAIDNNVVNAKYLHFKGTSGFPSGGAGFQVTPSIGPSLVTGLTFTTANDAVERDPTAYTLFGSNTSINGPYTLIAVGDIVDFSQPTAWPRFTMNTTPITFFNDAVYRHYQLLFPAIRDVAKANSVQIGEVELLGCEAAAAGVNVRQAMLNVNASLWVRVPFDFTTEEAETFDVLSLRMKYEDGFVAYLNGIEVARRNFSGVPLWNSHADGDRPHDAWQNFTDIDLSGFVHLLRPGRNVLAIQALNDGVSDEDFFIQPELTAATSTGIRQYFTQATPGAFNVSGAVGIVGDTKFSVDRGFYDAPFQVAITSDTSDATIHYTVDGSTPTETSGLTYGGPITITGTTCLRAMAFKPGWLSTNVDTQTYIFLDQVIRQPAAPAGFPASWGATAADYAMDQRVVDDARYSGQIREALVSLPTVSIVTDMGNLFGPSGIYENPVMEGAAWERPASIEWINCDGSTGFHVNAGLRIYGGAFRRFDLTRKKTFRILFKRQYGPGKLDYPLFDDQDAVTSFDTVILRAGANDGWNNWGKVNTQYIVDEFMRRTQLALGQPSPHGRFVHLYIDGLYWGMYNLVERPETSFAASYFGGDKTEWDALNAGDNGGTPVGGSSAVTWNAMLSQIRGGMGSIEAYQKIQGNNADGTNNPAYDDLLDVDNYIDYLFSNFWGGTGDWGNRNWYVACRRPPEATGFKFFNWDMEGAIIIWSNLNANVISRADAIQVPFQALRQNEEFRLRFADHIQRHAFDGGPGTPDPSYERYKALADEVELAIIAESARWGDQAQATPYTQADWRAKRDYILDTYMPQRPAIVLQQLRDANLYPTISAPVFWVNDAPQHGGAIATTDEISMTVPEDVVYIETELVGESVPVRVHVPVDNSLGLSWTGPGFVPDSKWSDGSTVTGVGYERDSGYENLIGTSVDSQMYNRSTSVLARIEFEFDGLQDFEELTLQMKYDDGFIAYLNGTRVCTSGNVTNEIPGTATAGSHEAGSAFDGFPITTFKDRLVAGRNVLAVHGINISKTSTDMLILPKLIGKAIDHSATTAPAWYTLDGSDPRLQGGAVNPDALESTGSHFLLPASRQIKARTLRSGTWSALNEAVFSVGPVKENLRITEIMYHPVDPNAEFIELQNIGAESINLNLVRLTEGIDFTFGDIELGPDAYVLVVGNQAGFMQRYAGFTGTIAGEYTGSLSNNDDTIRLCDAVGTVIHEFTYKDGWYDITDGEGFSLTIRDPYGADPALWGVKDGWRPSAAVGGTPGYDDAGWIPDPGAVVINEVLAHSHGDDPDWIELHNTTDALINIGGWFLSDDNATEDDLTKYEIATGTSIPANGYIVFYQDETFGNPSDLGSHVQFGLSEGGDTIYLRSGSDGVVGGYEASESFGASASGVALGRYVKSVLDAGENFVAMSVNTPWTENAYPKVGPVIITEIMYNPDAANTGGEYIELHNITGAPILLADEASTETLPGVFTTETVEWRFSDGINFTFPPGTVIGAHGYLIIAKEPTAFADYYGQMPAGVDVLPMGDSSLSNGGERLQIVRPGDQEYGRERFWIRTERVNYDDAEPWPTEADAGGMSLSQKTPDTEGANYGNDAENWQATIPNPGL